MDQYRIRRLHILDPPQFKCQTQSHLQWYFRNPKCYSVDLVSTKAALCCVLVKCDIIGLSAINKSSTLLSSLGVQGPVQMNSG